LKHRFGIITFTKLSSFTILLFLYNVMYSLDDGHLITETFNDDCICKTEARKKILHLFVAQLDSIQISIMHLRSNVTSCETELALIPVCNAYRLWIIMQRVR
jgi:hypothetical protein